MTTRYCSCPVGVDFMRIFDCTITHILTDFDVKMQQTNIAPKMLTPDTKGSLSCRQCLVPVSHPDAMHPQRASPTTKEMEWTDRGHPPVSSRFILFPTG